MPDLRIMAWARNYTRLGPVRAVQEALFNPRVHAPSSLTFKVAERYLNDAGESVLNRSIPHLRGDGARVVVTYTVPGGSTVTRSGTIGEVSGEGTSGNRVLTFAMMDDWQDVFGGTLAWPIPTNPITGQGTESSKWSATGPAETVLINLLNPNRARLGKPLTVPATLGRGQSVTVSARMQPLTDVLWPVTESVIAEVYQVNNTRQLVVREPAFIDRTFTEASGAVVSGTYLLKAPTVTRVVVGWGGEKQARSFAIFPTSVASSPTTARTAVESTWGLILEQFVDGTDLEPTAADFTAQRLAKADEALAEGAPRSSVSAELQETERLQFCKTYRLGDVMKVQLVGGPVVQESVREVEISWVDGNQPVVVPKVGLWEDSPDAALYRKVAASDKRLRLLGAR